MPQSKTDQRFAQAVRSSGLVEEAELTRALEFQTKAAGTGRTLPLDRILLKFDLLDREQILGLWRALRYYLWRKEDKFYVKLAIQSKILTKKSGQTCLHEQKQAYKHEDQLIRVNEIARRRRYVDEEQDQAIVTAMHKIRPVTLRPLGDRDLPDEPQLPRPAPVAPKKVSKKIARKRDLDELRAVHESTQSVRATSEAVGGFSDEDLDALWDEANLSDVELDSQAIEITGAGLLDSGVDDDSDEDDLFGL